MAIAVLALAAGCSSAPAKDGTVSRTAKPAGNTVGERAARIALDQVGTPYRYGGSGPTGFDCSGLVHYSYGRVGKAVPRTTGQLWEATRPVGRRDLRDGDLVFFKIDGKMSHVGLYVGEERFVHAPSTGRQVSVASLESPFYRTAFVRGGRPE